MRRYALRDNQWSGIAHLLPGWPGSVGVTAADNLLFVEAVLFRYRAGIPWRDLPERFGVWKRVFELLAEDADNEYTMIDSTIVRAHQHSADAQKKSVKTKAIGRSRGGLSTKIHTLVDALGYPIGFHLTGGEAHDLVGADHLLPDMAADTLIADRACWCSGHSDARPAYTEPPALDHRIAPAVLWQIPSC